MFNLSSKNFQEGTNISLIISELILKIKRINGGKEILDFFTNNFLSFLFENMLKEVKHNII